VLTWGRDARDHEPVLLVIGAGQPAPVLDLQDAVAAKVSALLGRAAARDYIDVAAAGTRFTAAELLQLVFRYDPGLPPLQRDGAGDLGTSR